MTRLLSDMSSQCCLIVATLLCFFSTSATAHLIKPYSYDLTFKLPLADQATFSGSLVLHFQLQQDTDTLVLNSHGLSSFRNISLISNQQNPLDFTIKSVKILSNTLEISYQEVLTAGEYLLTIEEYEGKIYNSTYGLFRRDKMFTTHLQPHGASRLFPCVDDISIKAHFRVSVIHSTDTVAQANTIATDVQVVDQNWQKTVFAPTFPLPTYLVAFSVMPDTYLQLSRMTSFGVTLRVHSPTRGVSLRVLDITLASFELLASMMEVTLPLNKIDFVLVDDYEGGMENWGHVAISHELAATGDDAHLTYVVAHELAHHWIGNQATVDSWSYVCLQEDLSDYISYKVVRALFNNDERYSRFRLSKYVEIQLAEDFVSSSHSLLLPPNITKEMISSHCYLKGVTYLESLEAVVGEQYMFSTLRSLVLSHSTFNLTVFANYFKDIVVDDNITLSHIYTYWYTAEGFPSILVVINGQQTYIEQMSLVLWPLRLAPASGPSQFMFSQTISQPTAETPLLYNSNFSSFVRVNYDRSTWENNIRLLQEKPQSLSAVGRAQIVSDFCYFHSQSLIPNSTSLRDKVIEMVYTQHHLYELCDWNLYWCYSSKDISVFTAIVRQVLAGFTSLFYKDNAFGCQKGAAASKFNDFCLTLFGRKCL